MIHFITNISPRRFAQLLASDWTNIRRDPTLLAVFAATFVMILAMWRLIPWFDQLGLVAFGWPHMSDYLIAFVLCLPAMLIGWVVGFLFLEERDDGPMAAIAVTATGLSGLLAYRLSATWVLAAAQGYLGCRLLLSTPSTLVLVVLPLLIGVQAAIIALLLPAIARNKVEGLALTKVFNITALVPLLAVMDSPLKYLGAIVPTYWVGELMGLGEVALPPLVAAVLAVLVHGLVFAAVYRWAGGFLK